MPLAKLAADRCSLYLCEAIATVPTMTVAPELTKEAVSGAGLTPDPKTRNTTT